MKEIHCGEFIGGCPHVAQGTNEEEVLTAVREHAREHHGLSEIDDNLRTELLKAIKER